MKTTNRSLLFVIALSISTAANAAGSMLRVTCEGDDADARVFVNGKFKGECPLDLKVPSGVVQLRATKSINDLLDRVWEREITLGDDVAKRVEVKLEEIQYGEKKRQEYIKRDATIRAKAAAGDIESMLELAEIYAQGMGVPKDYAKAADCYRKAADAGSASAMLKLGMLYNVGKGVTQSKDEAAAWYKKAADKGNQNAIDLLKSLNRY
ncbi:MAG: tetratricopeptide repeat protein [Gallionella sp.]|nr:tetratricopeptide repeat protein [Gallionella sp.]